jgi:tetratricopeptide (TPR) repeat protein
VIVDTILNVCEECATPLTPITVANKKVIIMAVTLAVAVVVGGGYFAALKIKQILAAKAAETLVEVAQPLTDLAASKIKDLLVQIQKGGDTDKARRELEDLQRNHGLSEEDIEKLRREAIAQQADRGSVSDGRGSEELVRVLRSVYSDGVKTPEEQQQIEDLARQHSVAPGPLTQKEQEIKDRLSWSQSALKQGLIYASQKDYPQALKEFKHSTEVDPENSFAWANLAAAYVNLGRYEEAQAASDRALSLDSGNWLAHYNRGSLYAIRGENDRALEELSETLRLVETGGDQKVTRAEVVSHMKTDHTLDSLRPDARFREMLK